MNMKTKKTKTNKPLKTLKVAEPLHKRMKVRAIRGNMTLEALAEKAFVAWLNGELDNT